MLPRVSFVMALSGLTVLAVADAGAGGVKGLLYQFKAGETYSYAVKIVADRPDATETYEGQVHLTVKSIAPDGVHLTPAALLPGKTKSKVAAAPGKGFKGKGAPGSRTIPITMSNPKGFPLARDVTVDFYGNMLKPTGDIGLSYLLGSVTRLVVEPMSRTGEMRWQRDNDVVLREIESLGPFGKGPTNETRTAAKETVVYEVAGTMDALVRIKKTSNFQTAAAGNTGPRVQMQGSGELVFDTKLGLMKSCEYQATLTVNEGNVSVGVPLTVSYRLLDAAEAAALKKEREEMLAKANATPKQRIADAKALGEAELTKALTELKGGGPRATFAAKRLAEAAPSEDHRAEVVAALEDVAKSTDGNVRSQAARALGVWGTQKNVPTLLQMLKDSNPGARQHAIEALGSFPDAKAAEALAQLLPELGVKTKVSASLKAMGPVAEKAVVPYIRHPQTFARSEACKILAEIGTKQSLAALKLAAADSNRLVATEAANAMQAIQARKK
jgi:hypothetical protein